MNARKKLIGTVVVAAAFFVPVAQAEHPDNRAEARGPGALTESSLASVRPDDRAGARGPGAYGSTEVAAAMHPDNRAGIRGPGAFTPTTVVVESSASGFDWEDAALGGLGGMGFALVLGGCAFLLSSQRNKMRVA